MTSHCTVLATSLALAVALQAQAETATATEKATLPRWEVGVGIGAVALADYPGSDQRRAYVVPLPYFVYRGERVRADRRGLSAKLIDSELVDVDLSLSASAPVRSDDNTARRGMPNLATSIEFGPQFNIHLHEEPARYRLDLRLPLRLVYGIDRNGIDSIGSVFSPSVNLSVKNIQRSGWNGNVNIGPSFSSAALNNHYYGVATEFANSQRAAYSANAGYSGTQFSTSVTRRDGRFWYGGFLRLNALHGAAFRDSPLFRQANAWSVGVGFSYLFAQSSERVSAAEEP